MRIRFIIAAMVSSFVFQTAFAVPPGSNEEIQARLEPLGSVCRAGDNCAGGAATGGSTGAAMTGQQVYDKFCTICHATGVADAPKLGSGEDWQPRLAKGLDTLWATTQDGLGAMPARGTCTNCSDDELRAALDYMVESVE